MVTNIRPPKSSPHPNIPWHIGDAVQMPPPTTSTGTNVSPEQYGIIRHIRNGWYTVELLPSTSTSNNIENTPPLIKCRAAQLQLIPTNISSTPLLQGLLHTATNQSHISMESSPVDEFVTHIIDLDQLLLLSHDPTSSVAAAAVSSSSIDTSYTKWDMEQLQYFQSVSTWVVFSDLHCSVHSIETCVNVLRQVHRVAQQHTNSGIMFLGDFWHIRSHTIRIDLLHRILSLFQQHYTLPMILIPGNHDQISSSSSFSSTQQQQQLHSLTPFQNAYRIPIRGDDGIVAASTSINGVLILDEPTKFMNALFIPHIRSPVVMENILKEMYGTNLCSDNNDEGNTSQPTSHTRRKADIIFCHVDVTGASMNDNIVSQGGISIQAFPPNIPIYSGHFHKPHNVTSTTTQKNKRHSNTGMLTQYKDNIHKVTPTTLNAYQEIRRVEYIGSPYQVSLSESQQNKRILLLNSTKSWECFDRIPIHVGRRHYRPNNLQEFLSMKVASSSIVSDDVNIQMDEQNTVTADLLQAGDRVVFSIEKHDLDEMRSASKVASNGNSTNSLDEQVTHLRNTGITVEIREVNTLQSQLTQSFTLDSSEGIESRTSTDRVDMSPSNLWSAFITQQVQRGAISPTNEEMIRSKGKEIIDSSGVASADTMKLTTSENMSRTLNESMTGNFQLYSVSLSGFGPFHEPVTYPLFNRGLVLLRGSNKDGGSDSNGSGKTSLAMSILWAFTGSVDPRPLQDSKVVDVINDASKSATVTIDGVLNGIKFSITRTKTSNRGSLSFIFDDVDITRQSIKDTQDMINEKLGINPQVLARTMFNGQHALNELLEASDTKLKDELSLVVPLSTWQDALLKSRQKHRDSLKRISELDGMISVRSTDVVKLKLRFEEAESIYRTECDNHDHCKFLLEGEIESLSSKTGPFDTAGQSCKIDFQFLEDNVLSAANSILDIEHELVLTNEQRHRDLNDFEKSVDRMKSEASALDQELQALSVECNQVLLSEALLKDRIVRLEEMWKLDLSAGIPDPFVLPQNCPTCHQPILSRSQHDKHSHLESTVRKNAEESLSQISDARAHLYHLQNTINIVNVQKMKIDSNITDVQNIVNKKRIIWEDTIKRIECRLHDARDLQQQASLALSETAKTLNAQSKIASLRTKITSSKELVDQAAQRVDQARAEWNECKLLVEELDKERSNHVEMSRLMMDLCDAFGTRGIQTFVMQGAVSTLEGAAQAYLDDLSDGAQRLHLSLDSNDSIVRKAYVRGENGVYKERALASLSGGQWRRCSLAFTLAFADLVANRANFRPSMIVLDEPLMHLDQSGRSNVGRLLRKLLRRESEQNESFSTPTRSPIGLHVSTILIILQDLAAEELEESFDCIDEVVKENGVSTVFVDQ